MRKDTKRFSGLDLVAVNRETSPVFLPRFSRILPPHPRCRQSDRPLQEPVVRHVTKKDLLVFGLVNNALTQLALLITAVGCLLKTLKTLHRPRSLHKHLLLRRGSRLALFTSASSTSASSKTHKTAPSTTPCRPMRSFVAADSSPLGATQSAAFTRFASL